MASDTPEKAVNRPPVLLTWAAVLIVFAVLDTATTHVGLSWGATEANGMVVEAIHRYGMVYMLTAKAIVSLAAVLAYRILPRPHRVGIPAGLGLVGSLVVTWNLLILVVIA